MEIVDIVCELKTIARFVSTMQTILQAVPKIATATCILTHFFLFKYWQIHAEAATQLGTGDT
jgi:hypothetical protein